MNALDDTRSESESKESLAIKHFIYALNKIMIIGISDGTQQLPPNEQSIIAYDALKYYAMLTGEER